jgi:predicted nucleotidyltransferase component of viral defense system
MFYNILDKKRLGVLPLLKNFKKDFYLAGGTGLALQLGHRDSVDFDFFSPHNFSTEKLFTKIKRIFKGYKVIKTQEAKNTLSVLIDDKINLSFSAYQYPLLRKTINTQYLRLASLEDIACMKLSAITGRATNKDYIDIYFILQKHSLPKLLSKMKKKFPNLDINLVLKSLVYFDDLEQTPIKFKNNNRVTFREVRDFLQKEVKKLKNNFKK